MNEIIKRVEIVNKAKEIKTAFITHHGILSRNVKKLKEIVADSNVIETEPSLVTHFLLGKNYIDFAFL